jgi:hypothetical protein
MIVLVEVEARHGGVVLQRAAAPHQLLQRGLEALGTLD